MVTDKTLCVTGHRPDRLPFRDGDGSRDAFLQKIDDVLAFCRERNFTRFISGGALGADTDFALRVISLRKRDRGITLEIAVPCANQSAAWSKADKENYERILGEADSVTVLSEAYTPYCMQKRNEYMVDKSDCVLCCYGGAKNGGTYNTIMYAQRKKKDLIYLPVSLISDKMRCAAKNPSLPERNVLSSDSRVGTVQTCLFDDKITVVKKIIVTKARSRI